MLALGDNQARLCETPGQVEDGGRRHAALLQVEQRQIGQHVHAVAGVDRLRFAPQLPHRRAVVAHGVAVFDVVVDEREVVQQLQRHGGGDGPRSVAAACFDGQQTEQRAQALADGRLHRRELLVQPAQVVAQHAIEVEAQGKEAILRATTLLVPNKLKKDA